MKIAIIGAGASGMMAMAILVEQNVSGSDILFFDGNTSIGKKVAITGGGRCNITTAITKKKELLPKYPRGEKILDEVFGEFSPKKCRAWFEERWLVLEEEDNFRLFPQSRNSKDVLAVFEKIASEKRVDMHLWEKVTTVKESWEGFVIETSVATYFADICLLATGGAAYTHTGSEWGGYTFAKEFWHTITTLAPSLSALLSEEDWIAGLAGLSLPGVQLQFQKEGKITQTTGGLLFTPFGITGPGVFALSSHIAFEVFDSRNPLQIFLSFDAQKTAEVWEKELLSALEENKVKNITTILGFFIPKRLAEVVTQKAGVSEKTGSTLSKEDRKKLISLLTKFPISVSWRRPWEEFVTAWWVETAEIHEKTMQSKIHPRLFIAGELLNIDGYTGGFNLQACWATGYCAGKSISEIYFQKN